MSIWRPELWYVRIRALQGENSRGCRTLFNVRQPLKISVKYYDKWLFIGVYSDEQLFLQSRKFT